MAAATDADRMRASRLRKKTQRSHDESRWLREYEGRRTSKRLQLVAGDAPEPPAHARIIDVPVNETAPVDSIIDPSSSSATWTPTVPPPANDEQAQPPPPGAPPPPPAGSPVIDGAPVAGDPHAAKQFAALLCFLTTLGMRAGLELADELAADVGIPDEWMGMLASKELAEQTLTVVAGAAVRVAEKYGFRSIPMADEAICAVAGIGSLALLVHNFRRKRKAPPVAKHKSHAPTGGATNEEATNEASVSPDIIAGLPVQWS